MTRFVICAHCKYHMHPAQTDGRECLNQPRCNGRVAMRLRDKAAAGKGRR